MKKIVVVAAIMPAIVACPLRREYSNAVGAEARQVGAAIERRLHQ